MASKFQKQLVGTVILVGISVAILPSLFDGKKWNGDQYPKAIPLYTQSANLLENNLNNQAVQEIVYSGFDQSELPSAVNENYLTNNTSQTTPPDIKENLNTQQATNNLNNEQSITHTSTVSNNQSVKNTQTQEVSPLPKRYVIQLAAFSNHQMANDLVNFLKPNGYNAFLLKTNEVSRVFIGPSNSEELLLKEIPKLKTMTGLDGKIVALK